MQSLLKRFTAAVLFLAAAAVCTWAAFGPMQDLYRRIHRLPDENGMYQIGEQWYEVMPELSEVSAKSFAQKLANIQSQYLSPDNRVFYAIIPDKSWFIREEGYSTVDQLRLEEIVRENLPETFTEINLLDSLSTGCYYRTDRHWRQETLQPVLDKLGEAMGFSVKLTDFTEKEYSPFIGSYHKYLPDGAVEESLIYLENADTKAAVSENYQYPEVTAVYDLPRLDTDNTYDVYLSGVSPYITICNPNIQNGKELVIFRDSFGSSLAPLLCGEYETITLVDLRFMFTAALPDFLSFTDQDVLFLYSTWIVNNSAMLRS